MARPVTKDGKQIPRMFYVPARMWAAVGRAAKRQRVSMSEWVRQAISEKLNRA